MIYYSKDSSETDCIYVHIIDFIYLLLPFYLSQDIKTCEIYFLRQIWSLLDLHDIHVTLKNKFETVFSNAF